MKFYQETNEILFKKREGGVMREIYKHWKLNTYKEHSLNINDHIKSSLSNSNTTWDRSLYF